jgi:NitT/TauT family transport system permease protein
VKELWIRRAWGEAAALLNRSRRIGWTDVLIVVGLAGLLYGLADLAQEWQRPRPTAEQIDLSPWALPGYTFFSLMRGLIAYVLSLTFTLVYGYWAVKDRVAERMLIPLLDVLQSIPVLSFLPAFLLALVAVFPFSNIGIELAAILMIFTGQAWNMTFSFYHSVRSVPEDQREVATVYRFNWWQRFRWVELPYSTVGLVWNSMMSMAGGWVFLMVTESFKLKDESFQLPGIGSYMAVAVEQKRYDAMAWAFLAMVLMIVGLDQLLWKPVVVWAQKFRVEEGGAVEEQSSWFLNWLRRSHILMMVSGLMTRLTAWREARKPRVPTRTAATGNPSRSTPFLSQACFVLLLGALCFGAYELVLLLWSVSWNEWRGLAGRAAATFARVMLATAVGTLWVLPAGLAIGLSPRKARILQPVIQVIASFPAPLLFPLVMVGFQQAGISLNWGSILLMLFGTQWYILFNVIAGAMAIPADLREAARSYRISGWQQFRTLYLPAVFPFLVTGWVTAAGGAWNLSIVSEYDVMGSSSIAPAWGLGARISEAFANDRYSLLAASTIIMSLVVVVFNRTVWRRLYHLAEVRYSLNK